MMRNLYSEISNLSSEIPLLSLLAPVSPAFVAQLPAPTANNFAQWLLSAVAAMSIVLLAKQFMRKTPLEAEFLNKKEFQEFRDKVDTNFNSVRDRIDHSHQALATKLDTINTRLHDVSSLVARLDERTKLVAQVSKPAVSQASSLHGAPNNQEAGL